MEQYDKDKIQEIRDRLLPGLEMPLEERDIPYGTYPFRGYNEFLQEMMETIDETHKFYGPKKATSVFYDYAYEFGFLID